ncbi:protein suppressor of gene silencing [Datura stramonium]|uniref:Protein suppressor of gene silencing n=1 Tax=Datura stramonium TaxID=4076 RepID=A0ABS8UPW7_DATST|nr:protein suppressor of gene silencing [Datura stramonium]
MSSSSNKVVGKPCNKSTKMKSITEKFRVDEKDVGVGDSGFKSDQNVGWVVCARKSKNKGSTTGGKKQWTPQNPISESQGNKISTWGHANDVQKLGLCNNVESSNSPIFDDDFKDGKASGEDNKLDLPSDDSDEDEFLSDNDFGDHSNVKEMSYEALKKSHWFKKFLECLDKFNEELCQRGTIVVPLGEVYARWGVAEFQDKELPYYFRSYAVVKAVLHSYGPRGISVMIFEATVAGYMETLHLMSEKHYQTVEENKILKLKTIMHYEENKEETVYQQQFLEDQFKKIYHDRIAKEDKFKKIQQEPREMINNLLQMLP